MLKTEDKNFLRNLLARAFADADDIKSYRISIIERILLDASDMYCRMADAPYGDYLVYSCIELTLYREGYHKTARQFNEFYHEEMLRPGHKRFFEEEKR